MKQRETTFRNIVLILSFLYAGFCLLVFVLAVVTIQLDGNFFLFNKIAHTPNGSATSLFSLIKEFAIFTAVITGLGTIISVLGGLSILRSNQERIHTHAEEEAEEKVTAVKEKVKQEVSSDVLLPEEKELIKVLETHEGVMTQKELVQESGMSKVRIHRVLKRLEAKKVITKYDYGMTKRIRLEKKLNEEDSEAV